ncbi:MAG: hypothetical protein U0835_24370 [Isosphaeraceae bacterium]
MWPGTNWVSRDKSLVTRHFLQGTPRTARPHPRLRLRQRVFLLRGRAAGASTLGITIHDWERQNCEEMRDYPKCPRSG